MKSDEYKRGYSAGYHKGARLADYHRDRWHRIEERNRLFRELVVELAGREGGIGWQVAGRDVSSSKELVDLCARIADLAVDKLWGEANV